MHAAFAGNAPELERISAILSARCLMPIPASRLYCSRRTLFLRFHGSAMTASSMRQVLRTYRVTTEKVHTIYEGVDHRTFQKLNDPKAVFDLRNRYNLKQEFLLFVGDIHPRRNLGKVIDALHQLKSLNLQL